MGLVQVLTDLGGGLAQMFVSVITTLATVFFTVTETGIEITAIGYIALISLVLTIVWRLFNFIKSLVKAR